MLTPDLSVGVGDRLASVDIENLEFKVQVNAGLSVGNILADELSRDVVGAFGDLGAEDARAVAGEDGLLGGVEIVVLTRQVRGVQGGEITDYILHSQFETLIYPRCNVNRCSITYHPSSGPSSR